MSHNQVVTTAGQAVTVKQTAKQIIGEMTSQVALIQAAITEVMIEGEHYGVIPGCANKSLYKAGAEKLLVLFRLGVDPSVEIVDDGDSVTYRVKTRLFHIETGNTVGFGLGECATSEDKYNWRAAVCPEEYDGVDDTRKRVKWSKGKEKAYSVQQVRTNYKDLANTVLKMAKKRSLVDAVLTCTAASDCFTQDLEDFDPEYAAELANAGKNTKAHQNNSTPPKTTSAAANASSDDEASALKAHGLWIVTKDGEDIVEGNTYKKGDFIKPFGFKWDGDAKRWKRPAKAKASTQPATEKSAKAETKQSMTLEEIDNAIAEIGGILSEPTPKNGKVFVQAVNMEVDETVRARLKELGFKEVTGKWVKDVTSLFSEAEIKDMEEAKNLFS